MEELVLRRELLKAGAAALVVGLPTSPQSDDKGWRRVERRVLGRWYPIDFDDLEVGMVARFGRPDDTWTQPYRIARAPIPCPEGPVGNSQVVVVDIL